MAHCQVAYRDIEGIEHRVDVQADTLFEAVAIAVSVFRKGLWNGCPPGPGCCFDVRVSPDTPQSYKVELRTVEQFARFGTTRGPKDIVRKRRLQDLLGLVVGE